MSELRVFLADDHAVVREGLKALVNAQPGMAVVGEAADGLDACERVPAPQEDHRNRPRAVPTRQTRREARLGDPGPRHDRYAPRLRPVGRRGAVPED
jgi:hypothetical protein